MARQNTNKRSHTARMLPRRNSATKAVACPLSPRKNTALLPHNIARCRAAPKIKFIAFKTAGQSNLRSWDS